MKKVLVLLAAAHAVVSQKTCVAAETTNKHYVANQAPLKQTAYAHLPPGAVRAKGWLEDQLRLQADGLTSYLWSAFVYPFGDSNPQYHQEGVVSLALVLSDNPRLSSLPKAYVERRLNSEGVEPKGYLSRC